MVLGYDTCQKAQAAWQREPLSQEGNVFFFFFFSLYYISDEEWARMQRGGDGRRGSP